MVYSKICIPKVLSFKKKLSNQIPAAFDATDNTQVINAIHAFIECDDSFFEYYAIYFLLCIECFDQLLGFM